MGSLFKYSKAQNETHTHGSTMGREITAMEKKKIEEKLTKGKLILKAIGS